MTPEKLKQLMEERWQKGYAAHGCHLTRWGLIEMLDGFSYIFPTKGRGARAASRVRSRPRRRPVLVRPGHVR